MQHQIKQHRFNTIENITTTLLFLIALVLVVNLMVSTERSVPSYKANPGIAKQCVATKAEKGSKINGSTNQSKDKTMGWYFLQYIVAVSLVSIFVFVGLFLSVLIIYLRSPEMDKLEGDLGKASALMNTHNTELKEALSAVEAKKEEVSKLMGNLVNLKCRCSELENQEGELSDEEKGVMKKKEQVANKLTEANDAWLLSLEHLKKVKDKDKQVLTIYNTAKDNRKRFLANIWKKLLKLIDEYNLSEWITKLTFAYLTSQQRIS